MKILPILARVVPIAMELVPLVEKLFKNLPGSEKKNIAVELIKPVVRAAEAVAGKDLLDEDALAEAADKAVDAVVALLNAVGVFKK